VADSSHELRTPLTTIRGNAELLLEFPDVTPDDRAAALLQIRREAERLSRLVHDLLTLARADARQPLARRPVALAPLLEDVVDQARRLTSGQALTVEIRRPATVVGDPDALRQVILILLDNAVKHTPAGGRITARLEADAGQVRLAVIDTGRGVAPRDLPHIFERFYRADPSRRAGGAGLGLAIAKWIAEQHAGAITVHSVQGQGATFTVELPCPTAATRRPADAR
jgi:signal transduction histidine kinase